MIYNKMFNNEIDMFVCKINEKIEFRLNGLQNFRLSLLKVNKVDELKNERNEIIKYFFELEDDLRHIIHTLKTLLNEKNKLYDHIRSNELVFKQNELKNINVDKDIGNLTNQIQDLIQVNRILNEKSFKDENEIKQLRQSIKLYEEQLSRKQLEIENLEINNKMNSYNLGYHITNERNTLFMQTQDNNSNLNSRNDKETLNNVINEYLTSHQFSNTINQSIIILNKEFNSFKTFENIKNESDIVLQSSVSKGFSPEMIQKKENKIGKLVGLLVKIKNSNDVKKYCTDKLGRDFIQTLLSEKVSENFLDKVEDRKSVV